VDVDRQKQEYANFVSAELFPLLEEASTDNVQILYTGPVLTDHEVFLAVRQDTYFAIGSLLFVWLYMSVHLRTPILALLGMGVVALSFPMGLVFFRMFGYSEMAIINYLALFILTGIGADNIFILTDLWRQAQRKSDDSKEQLHETMSKAGKAVSVCGVTTACSFLANSASAVRPVREFGIFVGTCVLCNLLLCLTVYPLILLLFERCKKKGFKQHRQRI
jgi:predicted RND superfamily exporter protein